MHQHLPSGAKRPIIVHKYGGSSVASAERIGAVADRIVATRAAGARVAVVVSAMGKTTDELVALAGSVTDSPSPRELDVLLTCGERISIALLAMALGERGVPAVSLTGRQAGIFTEGPHTRARIAEIRPERVLEALERDEVVVVAGFQGVSAAGDVTSLGRGGSDTTAVALAARLGAARCEIFSDVDGVYTADPRLCSGARRLERVAYGPMIELARQGARVLNADAVDHARRAGLVIRARSTFGGDRRTTIGPMGSPLDRGAHGVIAVTGRKDLVRVRARAGEIAGAVRAELGERVPLLATRAIAGGRLALWGIGEEIADRPAFARSLEERWPGDVEATAESGSVALVGQDVGGLPAIRELLASVLRDAGIAFDALASGPHAVTALIEARAVDDAIRALHHEAIERDPREAVSCAS